MISILTQISEFTWAKWLETQSPLWVVYAIVIVCMVTTGRMLFTWLPKVFQRHCDLCDSLTKTNNETSQAWREVLVQMKTDVQATRDITKVNHGSMVAVAAPFARGLVALATTAEQRAEVQSHVNEAVSILQRSEVK